MKTKKLPQKEYDELLQYGDTCPENIFGLSPNNEYSIISKENASLPIISVKCTKDYYQNLRLIKQ